MTFLFDFNILFQVIIGKLRLSWGGKKFGEKEGTL